ncbi:hypothetical protein [Nocardioides sp.]|uniref:hypothetical protein n=1 Tax=Nocardioides sp. TaxID=35761 RepID=UPI0035154C96
MSADPATQLVADVLTLYVLPVNYHAPLARDEKHRDVAERCAPVIVDALRTAGLLAAERERADRAVRDRNYAMRQRDEERRAKEGNIDALNAAIERADREKARADNLIRSIRAWVRHGEAVPSNVTTYDRWMVHAELLGLLPDDPKEAER